MVNSVLSATPLFFMSYLMVPKWVILEFDKVRKKILWKGTKDVGSGYSLISWDKITRPKKLGGLGVINLSKMNMALLAKWWWRIINSPEDLLPRIIKAKYGPRNGIWFGVDRNSSNISIFYKGILSTKEIFRIGLHIKVSNGQCTNFWKDKWIGETPLANEFQSLFSKTFDGNVSVNSLWDGNGWNLNIRRRLTVKEVEEKGALHSLLQNTVRTDGRDVGLWRWEESGSFSVRSMYFFSMHGGYIVLSQTRSSK